MLGMAYEIAVAVSTKSNEHNGKNDLQSLSAVFCSIYSPFHNKRMKYFVI